MDADIKKFLKYSTNIEAFIKDILNLECKPFHREWLRLFEDNRYVSLLAPRGHGKTVLVGSYIIWKIVTNPDIRILIVTINQDKANEIMSFMQSNLAANPKVIEVFGQQKGYSDWSKDTLRVYKASPTHKEPTLKVLGVTSSMIGGHYDLIILDDITDQKNSRTEHTRRELIDWFNKTLMPMLEPEGTIISIGTRWHQADIHSYFLGLSNYTTKVYKAILEDPSEENKNLGKVLWPERWSYEKLNEIRKVYGNVTFMMQYQNEYISDEDAPIKYDWIVAAIDKFDMPKPPYLVYVGVDLASKEGQDFFAMTVIAIKEGFIYVMDGIRGHFSLSTQQQYISEYFQKWKPVKIGIDQAAQQKMVVEDLMEKYPALPVVPIKPSIVNDSLSRAHRLSVFFETGRICLNPKLVEWVDEMTSLPRGAHDDTVDSLSFAIQSSQEVVDSNINWSLIPSLISVKRDKKHGYHSMYNITKI